MIIGKEFSLNPIEILDNWSYQDMLDTYSFLIYENDMQKKEYAKKANEVKNEKPKIKPKGLRSGNFKRKS